MSLATFHDIVLCLPEGTTAAADPALNTPWVVWASMGVASEAPRTDLNINRSVLMTWCLVGRAVVTASPDTFMISRRTSTVPSDVSVTWYGVLVSCAHALETLSEQAWMGTVDQDSQEAAAQVAKTCCSDGLPPARGSPSSFFYQVKELWNWGDRSALMALSGVVEKRN